MRHRTGATRPEALSRGSGANEEDACWGFIGHDYAKETLQGEYFDSVIERLKKPQEGGK